MICQQQFWVVFLNEKIRHLFQLDEKISNIKPPCVPCNIVMFYYFHNFVLPFNHFFYHKYSIPALK